MKTSLMTTASLHPYLEDQFTVSPIICYYVYMSYFFGFIFDVVFDLIVSFVLFEFYVIYIYLFLFHILLFVFLVFPYFLHAISSFFSY